MSLKIKFHGLLQLSLHMLSSKSLDVLFKYNMAYTNLYSLLAFGYGLAHLKDRQTSIVDNTLLWIIGTLFFPRWPRPLVIIHVCLFTNIICRKTTVYDLVVTMTVTTKSQTVDSRNVSPFGTNALFFPAIIASVHVLVRKAKQRVNFFV